MHIQDDSLVHDLLILAAYAICQVFYCCFHLRKVCKSLPRQLLEEGYRGCEWVVVEHTDLKRTTCDYALHKWIATLPRGRKSRPTICSIRLLLPELWLPTTTILGSCMYDSSLMSLSLSTNEITPRKLLLMPFYIYNYQINQNNAPLLPTSFIIINIYHSCWILLTFSACYLLFLGPCDYLGWS